ncbi:MAG: hypothetical protein MIO90_05510 [Methanomassiliicoccales archaeon]|nr:hypothetical protein [Methanomassiliicoccales archaeon]
MDISMRPMGPSDRSKVVRMITEFYNHHRRLTRSPEGFLQTDEASETCLRKWEEKGSEVRCIQCDGAVAGFLVLRYGGNHAA